MTIIEYQIIRSIIEKEQTRSDMIRYMMILMTFITFITIVLNKDLSNTLRIVIPIFLAFFMAILAIATPAIHANRKKSLNEAYKKQTSAKEFVSEELFASLSLPF